MHFVEYQECRAEMDDHDDMRESFVDTAWADEAVADDSFTTKQMAERILELQDQEGLGGFSHFEDHLFDSLKEPDDHVSMSKFFAYLRYMGLGMTDPRLRECVRHVTRMRNEREESGDLLLDRQSFVRCISENLVILKKVFEGEFAIPEFQRFCRELEEIHTRCQGNSQGKVADFIPQLARQDPNLWGVSICTIDGQRHSMGDTDVPFALQSVSKPLTYALALEELGPEHVHRYVGREPSGESHVTIKLDSNNKPHNPMINTGAMVTVSLVKKDLRIADRFDYLQQQFKKMAGGEYLGFNNAMYLSERVTSFRNQAIGHYLQEYKCFPEGANLKTTLDLYFQLCSIEVTCESASVMAATLANGGICPLTGEVVLDASAAVQPTLALMHSCGMYDYSGQFAFQMGLPAKSGVSGVIMLVIPNVMGVCLWSPPLDKWDISVRGLQFCQELVSRFNFHHFDNGQEKRDPRSMLKKDSAGTELYCLLHGAGNGHLKSLVRMWLSGTDMHLANYDGRTALHLAASEGHLHCVRFLLEKCKVPHSPLDRWQHTPLANARCFEKLDVARFLENYIARAEKEEEQSKS